MADMVDTGKQVLPAIDARLAGIGGWLLLPAMGFVLGLIGQSVALAMSLGLCPRVMAAGYGGAFTLQLIVQGVMLAFLIYAAVRFFGRKRDAPAATIALLILGLATSALLLLVELGSAAPELAVETGKSMVVQALNAAIWIPYFRRSRRVKATFVR